MKLLSFLFVLVFQAWVEAAPSIFNNEKIENEKTSQHNKDLSNDRYDYKKYQSLTDIHNELMRLERNDPDMVSIIDIGQSVENRSLLVIKISGRNSIPAGFKTSMWIDAGIHAREWIGPATAMYMIRELIVGNAFYPKIENLLDHMDFYFLPVMNPDGYEYSRINASTRSWRKNRRLGGECEGVDLNRNFDFQFYAVKDENDPCSSSYHGPAPFSEPESLAVKNFLEANKPDAYISLHSYSQMWLLPYAYKNETYPDDYSTVLFPLAIRATNALSRIMGTKYQIGTPADLLGGPAGGSTMDWAKGYLNVTYTYGIELRPDRDSKDGFKLPETEILPTGWETFEAIKVVADQLVNEFVLPKLWKTKGLIREEPTSSDEEDE